MQMENGNGDSPGSPINGLRCSNGSSANLKNFSGCDGKHLLENSESFYKKLSELYESSGLNLILNVRETLLNLHVFYKEVIQRGGYYQVTKNKRWEEVAVALKIEGVKMKFPSQLQQVYALFLFQFEQIYFYRAPEKAAADPGHAFYHGNSSVMKRKSSDSLCLELTDEEDVPVEKKILNGKNHALFTGGTAEQKLSPQTPSKVKETVVKKKKKLSPGRCRHIRTAYQIFIREECDRLKRTNGEKLRGQSFRSMADDAWRHLSEIDRQPYIEESNRDKEKYSQPQAAAEVHNGMEYKETERNNDGDYHVRPEFGKPLLHNQDAVDFGKPLLHDQDAVDFGKPLLHDQDAVVLANQTMNKNLADPILPND
ncbi:putative high mobility group B protein 11 [Humulus lupulus]|uniref:putative high mobility group B protein 11 n=1 Tax=Humulus lupulus TaxID=3486 RepID=UPI002B4012F1|nr:putative high mobility group B protein 11 [Humulus lupulus]